MYSGSLGSVCVSASGDYDRLRCLDVFQHPQANCSGKLLFGNCAPSEKADYGQIAFFELCGCVRAYLGIDRPQVLSVFKVLHPFSLKLNQNYQRALAQLPRQGKRPPGVRSARHACLALATHACMPKSNTFWPLAPAIGFAMKTLQYAQQCLWQGASVLLLGVLAGNAQADVVIELAPVHDHLKFTVPLSAPLAEGDQLAVELDGYDVTALLSCTASDCQLALPVPLSVGTHPLRAMIFYDNGDIATVLDVRVQVATGDGGESVDEPGLMPALTPSGAVAPSLGNGSTMRVRQSISALFSSGYRLAEKQPDNYRDVPHLASNGGLSYRGSGESPGWRWDAELDAIYDSLSENNPDGDQWVLPNYRLAASRGTGLGRQGVALGTYNLARENLLFSAYQRRGAVVSVGDEVGSPLKLDVFALQSEPVTGYKNRLGYPNNAQERSSGALLTFSPWQSEPQLLQLSSGLIKGETSDSGTGMWSPDEQTRYGGDTWNLAVDSYLGDNSLWLHADYARGRFDSDGIGYGQGERSDSAHEFWRNSTPVVGCLPVLSTSGV